MSKITSNESNLANRAFRFCSTVVLVTALAGCAGYTKQTAGTIAATKAGDLDAALADLEKNNTSKDKDLLYFLEKGELLRLKGRFGDSRTTWLAADDLVGHWEDDARNSPDKLLGDLGSGLLNDTTRRYDGRDYEKVFLNVRLALDHVAAGDWQAARAAITKMHEREAVIANFRAKELDAALDKSQKSGVRSTSFKELNGYPVETLDDPEVQALTNSYESAYANYLAGFIYEALGEPSLAAPGYRKAAEMRPNVPLIDDALKGLDDRVRAQGKKAPDQVDTLFVIETGLAPTIQSVSLPLILPIPSKNGVQMVATPLSWPVIRPEGIPPVPLALSLDQQVLPAVPLTDVNVMARRALSDEMPGIIARSALRAITRGAAQAALAQTNDKNGIGATLSLITGIAAVVTEQADERSWRALPGRYAIARAKLAPGPHQISLLTPLGPQVRDFQVSGRYAIVSVRGLENSLYVVPSPNPAGVPSAALDAVPAQMLRVAAE